MRQFDLDPLSGALPRLCGYQCIDRYHRGIYSPPNLTCNVSRKIAYWRMPTSSDSRKRHTPPRGTPAEWARVGRQARRARASQRCIPRRPCSDWPGASRIGAACGLRRWVSHLARPQPGNSPQEDAWRALEDHDGAAHPLGCPMLAISSSVIKSDINAASELEPNAEPSAQCRCRPGWEACVRAVTLVLS
jgi:hypothetical protein